MERAVNFAERPTPMDWGENKQHVPLNIIEVEDFDENGNTVKSFRADIVPKVEKPLNIANIVNAAVFSEYGEAGAKILTMALVLNPNENEDTKKYRAFVNEIAEAAKAEGYE